MAEDPEFARSFHEQRRQQPAPQGTSNGKIALAVALLLSAILLLAGFAGEALACFITTGLVCGMWWWLEAIRPEGGKDGNPR